MECENGDYDIIVNIGENQKIIPITLNNLIFEDIPEEEDEPESSGSTSSGGSSGGTHKAKEVLPSFQDKEPDIPDSSDNKPINLVPEGRIISNTKILMFALIIGIIIVAILIVILSVRKPKTEKENK